MAFLLFIPTRCVSQGPPGGEGAAIYGSVEDSHGDPVVGVTVILKSDSGSQVSKTDAQGAFKFSALLPGSYALSTEEANRQGQSTKIEIATSRDRERVILTLDQVKSGSAAAGSDSTSQFGFSDNPDFQVAGVTDWTAVGGHGSDTTLRTSEDLARETASLKPDKSSRGTIADAKKHSADQQRLTGEQDEKNGNPLAAVHEFELAVQSDPSEENYFAWGSELLLHRAVWQAQEVFRKGAQAYPQSARMLSALGTALFAGARYQEAAEFLCRASDLDPADPEEYLLMGRAQIAAPDPLPCIRPKLERFVAGHPDNSQANYLYAMAILKGTAAKGEAVDAAKRLLAKAVSVDPKCADGYLELGILISSSGDSASAIEDFNKAIAAEPELSEAHYRLGVTYDRIGQVEKAKREFALHDQLEKKQADEVERQRREIKQFVIVSSGDKSALPEN